MGPFIGISSTGILLALIAVFTRWRRFGVYGLISLTAFMCLFGVLSTWAIGFGELTGAMRAYTPFRTWVALSLIVTLACVVVYLAILFVGLKGQKPWAWSATLWTSLVAAVFGTVPSVIHLLIFGERASSWIRVILAVALFLILFTRQVKEVFPQPGGAHEDASVAR